MTTTPSQPNREELKKRFEEFLEITYPDQLAGIIRFFPFYEFIENEVAQALAEQRENHRSELEALAVKIEKEKVEEYHVKDCEYQRQGCDCGYENLCTYNRALSDAASIVRGSIKN